MQLPHCPEEDTEVSRGTTGPGGGLEHGQADVQMQASPLGVRFRKPWSVSPQEQVGLRLLDPGGEPLCTPALLPAQASCTLAHPSSCCVSAASSGKPLPPQAGQEDRAQLHSPSGAVAMSPGLSLALEGCPAVSITPSHSEGLSSRRDAAVFLEPSARHCSHQTLSPRALRKELARGYPGGQNLSEPPASLLASPPLSPIRMGRATPASGEQK